MLSQSGLQLRGEHRDFAKRLLDVYIGSHAAASFLMAEAADEGMMALSRTMAMEWKYQPTICDIQTRIPLSSEYRPEKRETKLMINKGDEEE
jgi:hypothetical protein